MGTGPAETVTEIERTRERLDRNLRRLEAQLPAPAAWVRRAVGIAVGGGLGSTVVAFLVRRLRARGEERRLRRIEQRLARLEEDLHALLIR
jgi:hypothetical protein